MNARVKGCAYERTLRKELKRWYPDIQTSRYGSKYADDIEKSDFVNCGGLFRYQAKALERAPSYHEVLASMPDDDKYNVIIHKKNRQGEVVVMHKEDFYAILDILQANNIKL